MLHEVNKLTQNTANQTLSFGVQYGTRNETGWSSKGTRSISTAPSVIIDTPPLSCRLYRKTESTYAVTVTDGCVSELNYGEDAADNVVEHLVDGTRDLTYPNLNKEYVINIGETVGVYFETDIDGKVNSTPKIQVRAYGNETSSYAEAPATPPALQPGTVGSCYFVLAKCIEDPAGPAGAAKLEYRHSGSNIDYVPKPKEAETYNHPFKLEVRSQLVGGVEKPCVFVHYGRATAFIWQTGETVFNGPTAKEITVRFDSTSKLVGDPFSTSVDGFTVLAAPTYGVWLHVSLVENQAGVAPTFVDLLHLATYQAADGGANISVSSTYTEPGDGPAHAGTTSSAYFYLGKLVKQVDGSYTVLQFRRSDVVVPLVAFAHGIPAPEPDPPEA